MKKLLHKSSEISKLSIANIKINALDWLIGPVLLVFGFVFYPFKEKGLPVSVFALLNNFFNLNLKSPGEGMTRGISAFARTQFVESFEHHWFAPIFMSYLLFLTFKKILSVFKLKLF